MASTTRKRKKTAVLQRPQRPSRSLAKREAKVPAKEKEWTERELRAAYVRLARMDDDPKNLLSVKLFSRAREGNVTAKENENLARHIMITLAFENDHTVAMTVSPKYRGLAIELRRQIIYDLHCKSHFEKVLVDAVVSAYMRTLRLAEAVNAGMDSDDSIWPEKTNYLAMLSKELDRANRHLMVAYQTLLQLKQPPLKVQVKAKNAFIGQAQQFNLHKEEPTYEHIITP